MGKNAVIVLALVAAGFFAAYLRFRPYLGLETAYTDGARTFSSASAEDIRFAVWDAPVPLSELNSEARELRPALSPDGRCMVFAVGERGLGVDLFVAELEGDDPKEARPLLELCTEYDELAPAFSDDALFFATNRPGGAGGLDLWSAPYRDGTFGEPRPLGPSIGTPADETDPAPLPGTRSFAFASNRAGGFDLFLARPRDETDEANQATFAVELFEPLVTLHEEREPAFTADGRALFFASDRPGGAGGFDLWRSVRESERGSEEGKWLAPELVRGVNSAASERGPLPSRDGFTLLFSIEDGAGADLFRAHSRELFRLPGRPVGWLDLLVLASLLVLALLAWLAKRWRRLEILYKCFLASVAAHAALLLWFQHVDVEGSPTELPGRSALFQVRLAAASAEASSALRERGGDASVQRALGQRAELPALPATGIPSIGLAQAVANQAALPAPAPAPTSELRGPASAERRTLEREHVPSSAVGLAEREPRHERRDQAARPLDVAARPSGEVDPRPRSPADLSHAEPPAAVAAREATVTAPRAASLALGERGARAEMQDAISERGERDITPRRAQSLRVDVALPKESAPLEGRAATEAPEIALASPQAFALADRAARSERRPPFARTAAEAARDSSGPVEAPRAEPMAVADSAEPEVAPIVARAAPTPRPQRVRSEVVFRERPDPAGERGGTAPNTVSSSAERGDPARGEGEELEPAVFGFARSTPDLAPTRHRIARDAAAESAPVALLELDAPPGAADAPRVARKLELTPYRSRFGLEKEHALSEHGGGVETEAAVERGLAYLAGVQTRRGSWGRADHRAEKYFEVAVGKTGLGLLAFLGAGHTPTSATRYADVVERAVGFLLSVQDARSGHFGYSDSYGHGIATYALAECFALTGEERLRRPLERAVRHVLEEQRHDRGRKGGGWGYYYPDDRTFDDWPRVSISSWQVMALESARLGGLAVPDAAFEAARTFLEQSYDDRGWFRYSHDPERLSSGYPTLPGSTPAGLFALSLLGEDVASDRWKDAVGFVVARTPDGYRYTSDDAFVFRARGNEYFWYYATLALFRHGGSVWERWNVAMKDTLLGAQDSDGSWRPISVYSGYAGDHDGDRSYTTAMCVLTLEVYYRYFTPLLKVE